MPIICCTFKKYLNKKQLLLCQKSFIINCNYTIKGNKKMKSKDYLLVDGYNIIFAWKELKKLAEDNLEAAKTRLINQLCNYQGTKKMNLILVFDAYKVEGGRGSVTREGGIYVVYTKEAETADQYIEKTTHELKKNYNVTVATSDGLEQVIIMSQGALRMSAKDLEIEVNANDKAIAEKIHEYKPVKNNMLIDNLDSEAACFLEQLRLKR